MTDVKCGFMQKCGKSVKSWKKRWFVLKSNGYLYYYENKSCKQEKGKIDIVDASKIAVWKEVSGVEKKLPSGSSPNASFGIIVNDRTYTCVCEKEEECWSWLEAIKKVQESGGNCSYPEPTFPKEEPNSSSSEAPPPATKKVEPVNNLSPPANNSVDQYSKSLPRSGSVHVPVTDPGPNFSTMPRRPVSAVQPGGGAATPAAAPPPLPATNPYYTPEVAKAQQQATAPPPVNPNYCSPQQQARPPAQNPQYQPSPPQPHYPPAQPQYRQSPPQPQYPQAPPQYRPAQPQYPPQHQYQLPPAQPQYRPPPAQPQYYPPQPQYRPPMQQQYRPPAQPQYRAAAPYRPPVRPAQRAPAPRPQQYRAPGQVNKTTVTVVTTTQIRR